MSESAGPGSPVFLRCPVERSRRFGVSPIERRWVRRHELRRLGPTRPYRPAGALGQRSGLTSYRYRCVTCGHEGWSAHVAAARLPLLDEGSDA